MTATVSAKELRLHLGDIVSKVRRAGPIRMPPTTRPATATAQARSPAFTRSGLRVAVGQGDDSTGWRALELCSIGFSLRPARLILALLVALLAFLPFAPAQNDLPEGSLTLGTRLANDFADSTLDVLVPVWGDGRNLVFLNPRSTIGDDHEEEINAGIGYRHLLADVDLVLGANVYYDSHWTSNNNRFDQLGLGLEFLSDWVDARCNWYLPESGEKDIHDGKVWAWGDVYGAGNSVVQEGYGGVERARDGYDAEVGVRLPYIDRWADVRVFVGYYFWDDEFDTDSDLKGPKARVEARILPGLTVDAEVFEDEGVIGSEWYVGCRLHVPFDLGDIIAGRNPFAGATSALRKGAPRRVADRLGEMVMRDQYVRMGTGVSGTPARRDVLLSDVTFVDKDAEDSAQTGTVADPYLNINTALNSGAHNIKVAPAATAYDENVQLPANTGLYGQFVGHGGRVSDPLRPSIHGVEANPTVRLTGDNVTLSGFQITHAATGTSGEVDPVLQPDPWLGDTGDVGEVGVYGHDVSGVTISNNSVDGCYRGVLLTSDSLTDFVATLTGNCIAESPQTAISVLATGTGTGEFCMRVSGDFSGNRGGVDARATAFRSNIGCFHDLHLDQPRNGVSAYVYTESDAATARLDFSHITATSGASGVCLDVRLMGANVNADVTVSDLHTDGGGSPLQGAVQCYGEMATARVDVLRCSATGAPYDGVSLYVGAAGPQAGTLVAVSDVFVSGSMYHGLDIVAGAYEEGSRGELRVSNCQIENSLSGGMLLTAHGDAVRGVVSNCRVEGTLGGDGIDIWVGGENYVMDGAELLMSHTSMNGNAGNGLSVRVIGSAAWGDDAPVTCVVSDCQANGNDLNGMSVRTSANCDYWANDERPAPVNADVLLQNCTADGNGEDGIRAQAWILAEADGLLECSASVLAAGCSASNNGWAGLNFAATVFALSGGLATAACTVSDSTACGNGGDGVRLEADSSCPASYPGMDEPPPADAGGSASVEAWNVVANGNGDDGVQARIATDGINNGGSIALRGIQANGNGLATDWVGAYSPFESVTDGFGDGVSATAWVLAMEQGQYDRNPLRFWIEDITARDNHDAGIRVTSPGWDYNPYDGLRYYYPRPGDVLLSLSGVTSTGNGAEGVFARFVTPDGDVAATFDRVALNGNGFRTGADGLRLNVDTPGAIAVQGSNCAFTHNQDDGLQIDAAAGAASYALDFGGGALGAAGHNSFFGNLNGLGLRNSGSGGVSAWNCYWGRPVPIEGQDYGAAGTVDATHPLSSDPMTQNP